MEDRFRDKQNLAPHFQFVNVVYRSKYEKQNVKKKIRSHAMKAVRRRQRTSQDPPQLTPDASLKKREQKPHQVSQDAITSAIPFSEEKSNSRTYIPSPVSVLDQHRANPFQTWPVKDVDPEVNSLIDYCK